MKSDNQDSLYQTLDAATRGDPRASEELLPLVYDELRAIAAARMRNIPPGNTLQPTALVHEAYLRLIGEGDLGWNGRGHFFAAAALAMRQILVDQVRRKQAIRHGGDRRRVPVENVEIALEPPDLDLLALHLAIERLEAEDPRKARIVMLRTFAGLDREETARCLGISVRTVDREWRYIVARLHRELSEIERGAGR
jgi:RNA polymerase sigma factor (TIGR02999 family)